MDKKTILVVDDEHIIRDLLSRSLKRLGYNVVTAAGGYDALELYRSQSESISLVILDYIMPNLNGIELLEKLREINPGITSILSSGQPDAKLILETVDGIAGILMKPYLINELDEVVKDALGDKVV